MAEGYMATATLAPPQSEEDHDQAAAPASGSGPCIAGTSAAAPSTAVKGRRKVFDEHLDQDTIEAGLATGALIRGILRVSGSKLSIAFVRPEGARSDDRDLVVRGSQHRNRAVHGDVVIVQPILYGRQEESSSEEEAAPPAAIPCSDSEEEEIVLNKPHIAGAARAAPKSSEQEVQMAKVVAIAEKKGQGRVIVCTLHPDRDKKDSTGEVLKDDRFIRAVPTDKRLPTMLLQINNVTTKALRLPGKLDRFQLWPMQIQVWNESSKHPLCRLQGSCLGRAGSLEAEERHALIANELDSHDVDFCEEELDEVDQIVKAAQRDFESEAASRMDLRQKRIFTIDPATAKDFRYASFLTGSSEKFEFQLWLSLRHVSQDDLDDAIHVEDLKGKGQIEVGVHIADVGHFLKLGTITDEEARRRSTSVYLIGRVLPMLPHGLCNYLCSLNPNEPKLAFSAFFRLCKRTGQLIENPAPWFAKTAISSVCRLNYEQAQDIIDDLDIEEEDRPLAPSLHGDCHAVERQQIKDDILLLYEVCGKANEESSQVLSQLLLHLSCTKVRHGRLTGGAMTISKTTVLYGGLALDLGDITHNTVAAIGDPTWARDYLNLQFCSFNAGKRPAVEDDDNERPLTLNTLLAALKENREEIVAQVREDMDTITNRMSTVELTVDTHVANTTKLLEAMTDRHCAMEQSVRKVDEKQQSVLHRLELLEGKFAKANFSMSSTRTSETEGGNPRPALVVGGWDADQHHEETLRLVKQHLTELNINLDVSQAFVPGLRRGFALVPLTRLEGETEEEQRARVQEALRTIRAAKVVTGQRPEGGQRYFFAAMSQSPERRKRAQLAGKVKRLIIEEGGDVRRIDVEYGTANLWYNSIKVASGVTSAPEGASVEKSGWVHLGSLARQIGISEETAANKWGELRKALQ
ncbi:dis32 [Symbiodinium sp. CCMP2592]|nr:dis32 [Symbiodinium sp. CCMP2592]